MDLRACVSLHRCSAWPPDLQWPTGYGVALMSTMETETIRSEDHVDDVKEPKVCMVKPDIPPLWGASQSRHHSVF